MVAYLNFIILFVSTTDAPPNFLLFLGRFHTLILHLPIGILSFALLLELFSRLKRFETLKPAVDFTIVVGTASAVATAILGYFHSLEGGYDESTLALHQWSGIGVAVLSIVLSIIKIRLRGANPPILTKIYFPLFVSMLIILALAGYFGGTLTHGKDYLTHYIHPTFKNIFSTTPQMAYREAAIFSDVVYPILQKNCLTCHNPSKKKGGLVLNSPENVLTGGDNGAILQRGNTAKSEMFRRITLPVDHEDHMPPEGRKSLQKDEIELLRWWIESGAPFDRKVSQLEPPKDISVILKNRFKSLENPLPIKISAADPDDIEIARSAGFTVHLIEREKPYLHIIHTGEKEITGERIKKLRPISKQITSLDLGDSKITDDMLTLIAKFPHLQKLYLENTEISDAGLEILADLDYLEYLNLYGTKVSNNGLEHILKMEKLRTVYLWKTSVSIEALSDLQRNMPELTVFSGNDVAPLFGTSRLASPIIQAKKTVFKDSLTIEIESDFPGVKIWYTLNGSRPSPSALLYSNPIKIDQSGIIKAIAAKDEWDDSPVVSKEFVMLDYAAQGKSVGASTQIVEWQRISKRGGPGQFYEYNGKDGKIYYEFDVNTFSNYRLIFGKVISEDYGTAEVLIDGKTLGVLNCTQEGDVTIPALEYFDVPALSQGEHTLILQISDEKSVGIDGFGFETLPARVDKFLISQAFPGFMEDEDKEMYPVGNPEINWQEVKFDEKSIVQLGTQLTPNENCHAFAATEIVCDEDLETIMRLGRNDGAYIWLNGELVYKAASLNGFNYNEFSFPIKFKKGKNLLVLMSMQAGGTWLFNVNLDSYDFKTQIPML